MGIAMMCAPLTMSPEFGTGKTEKEKEVLLNRMNVAEKKWGRRCLTALLFLIFVVALVALGFTLSKAR